MRVSLSGPPWRIVIVCILFDDKKPNGRIIWETPSEPGDSSFRVF